MERGDWTREERNKSNIKESKRIKWREVIGIVALTYGGLLLILSMYFLKGYDQ